MYILGLNAYHADASAALFKDGELIAAIEEERLNRKKHCAGFPSQTVRKLLDMAGIGPADLDHVAISRDPTASLHKKVLFALKKGPALGRLVKDRLANVAKVRSADEALCDALGVPKGSLRAKFHAVEHHKAHIASSYLLSGFDDAACLSIDGFGDFASTMLAVGRGNEIQILDRVEFPHSAGIFYTAVTQYIGFPKFGEEWKVMGLAPYGKPLYVEQLSKIIQKKPNGRFELDLDYFVHHTDGVEMTWDDGSPHLGRVFSKKFEEVFGPAFSAEDDDFYGKRADLAHSAQVVYEDLFFHVVNHLQQQTGKTRLCLAGGCALNSVANGKLLDRSRFKEVYAQPAAGDNGTAIGAAAYVAFTELGLPRKFKMEHAYTGPSFDDAQIEAAIKTADLGGDITVAKLDDEALYARTVDAITDGRVVGWFQGRMEFGPRALGDRSIVADPRRTDMKDILNKRIKHRETFRPFAPSILEEATGEVFERGEPSPFMLMVYKVREEWRQKVPAITHVDNTGRLQTVSAKTNPRYHALISAFRKKTGVPLVLNTSFNEHEPVVCRPEEALACFARTKMDVLAIGNWFVERKKQA